MKKPGLFILMATALVGAVIAKNSHFDASSSFFSASNVTANIEGTTNDSSTRTMAKASANTVDDYNQAKNVYTFECPGVLPLNITKWNDSDFAVLNANEHWNGQSWQDYYEQTSSDYNSDNWSRHAIQEISLPKGKYMFSISARSTEGVSASASVKVGNSSPISVELPHKGNRGRGIDIYGNATFEDDATYANYNNGYGWEYRFVEFEVTDESQPVSIQLKASATSWSQWISMVKPQIFTSSKEVFDKINENIIKSVIVESDVNLTIANDIKYPWTSEADYIVNGNRGVKGSISTVSLSFSTDKTTEVSFDWLRNYYNWHTVELYVDGAFIASAESNNFVNKSVCVEKGNHVVMFKDTIGSTYDSHYNYDVSNIKNITIKKLDQLNIAISTPGSLGDSILGRVENFADVKCIKVSGNLNNEDLTTIKSRLVNLRDLDMTDVNLTELPREFFYNNKKIEFVKLPSKLEIINDYAFYGCYGLRDVTLPSSLRTIKAAAFAECDCLQQVILPEGLQTLGESAFYSCDHNNYVKLPSTLTKINNHTFYYNTSLKRVDFSEGLTSIDYNAFYQCYSLNDLVFPTSLNYIGSNSFAYNRSLSSITFNEGLYQIADNAFYDCDALTEVTLPSSLVLCQESPFDYCDNLKKVTCLSIEPPYMTDQIPYGLGMEGRELYVPALSLNVYKQTTGWDKFQTIKPIDYLPENFTVLSDLRLTLPENIPANYKPNVSVIHDQKGSYYWQYGSLTVNGEGTLSMNSFDMVWDPNYQYVEYNRQQNYNSLVNNSHLRADNVSINLFTRNDLWSFVSFPFNVKVSDIETISDGTTNWVIRKYDGQKRASGETSETWVRMSNDDVLNAGEGYIIQGSRYINNNWQDYSGFRMKAINDAKKNLIFNANDVTVTLKEYESEFAHNRSWNLIGNPYPCYYDTRFMDFNAPITVWDMRNNTYTAYSPSDDSYILCPGEAFFVQRPVDNGIISFAKEGRQTNRNVRAIEAPTRAKAFSQNTTNRIITNVTISDGENTDRTRVVLNDNATMDYEMDKDATKFMSSDPSVPQIFTSKNGINYAINERPVSDGVVSLNLHIGKDGLYCLSIPENVDGCIVRLEDKIEGKIITLTTDTEYTFSAKLGDCTGRFVLHFTDETTGIDEINSSIKENSAFYSIQGIKVTTPSQKGVYIQNGKKIMINK